MAKPKHQTEHQALTGHKPHIEKVRTHVRAHCKSEPLISNLLNTLDLSDKEFNEVFKSSSSSVGKVKKRGKAKTNGKDSLRMIVSAHLNHLIILSKLREFQYKLQSKNAQQTEIKTLVKAHPDIARQQFDFSKQISPEQALSLLSGFQEKTSQLEEDIHQLFNQHEAEINVLTEKRKTLLDDLAKKVKDTNRPLTEKELAQLFKTAARITS